MPQPIKYLIRTINRYGFEDFSDPHPWQLGEAVREAEGILGADGPGNGGDIVRVDILNYSAGLALVASFPQKDVV